MTEEEKKKEAEKQKQHESALKNLVIKKGDYSIHILVENIMNLAMVKENLPEPVVKVTCAGDDKRTKSLGCRVKENYYNEHFYFDHLAVNAEVFDSAKLLIEVYDSHNSDKEDYIGVSEIDYATIYQKPDHCLHNHWIALSNIYSETDFMSIKGYLKLSVSVLHEEDNRVELVSKDDDQGMIAIPPHIKPNYMQLTVGIIKGEEFPDMDSMSEKVTGRECQAFITMNYMGKTLKTCVINMKDNLVVWNELIHLPFTVPTTSEKIIFKIWDEDFGSNDLMGSFEVNIHDILQGKLAKPRYYNVYGAPATCEGKFSNLMNENPEAGSVWKGRVLIYSVAEETTEPIMGVKKFTPSAQLYEACQAKNLWNFDIELIDALFLPYKDGKVTFAFAYESCFVATPSRTVIKSNILKWNLKRKMPFHHLTNNADELGDIFVYLCKGEKTNEKSRVCFQRIPASEVLNCKDVLVIKLLADPSIGDVKDCKALLKLKIRLTLLEDGNKNDEPDQDDPADDNDPKTLNTGEKKVEPVLIKKESSKSGSEDSDDLDAMMAKKKKAKEEAAKKEADKKKEVSANTNVAVNNNKVNNLAKGHTIVANVFMSKEFIAGDTDGTSDPYVEVTLNGTTLATSIKNDQVNAVWNESLVFTGIEFDIDDISTWPILFFKVLDKDPFGSDDLGYQYVWLSTSEYQVNNLSKFLPRWHQFLLCLSDRPQGKLLISFYILDYTHPEFASNSAKLANLDISPETKLYSFEVNVLGLRNLEPLGLLPIKKPYIYFDMNSITIPNKNDKDPVQLKSIKTEPMETGSNPNINTTIIFKIQLPIDDVFMPTMTCMVYDKVLFGLSTDVLGVFSIDVEKMIQNTRLNMSKDVKVTGNKVGINVLTNILGVKLDDVEKMEKEIILNKKEQEEEIKKKALANPSDVKSENKGVPDDKDLQSKLSKDEKKEPKEKKGYSALNDSDEKEQVDLNQENIEANNTKANPEKGDGKIKFLKKGKKKTSLEWESDEKTHVNIIYPKFIEKELPAVKGQITKYKVEDMENVPDLKHYYELGYENPNLITSVTKKHYRRYYHTELENIEQLEIKTPFIKIPIYRDKFIDSKDANDVFNQLRSKRRIMKKFPSKDTNQNIKKQDSMGSEPMNKVIIQSYGHFKGLINVIENDKREEFLANLEMLKEKNPALLKDFSHFTKYQDLAKAMLVKKNLLVRLYVLELRDLAKKDLTSESDPYIKISLANTQINDQENHLDDAANAQIYRYWE